MSETYIVTAKTVDEAIAVANREYADADHEVSYEIIDMPKKGFFGIGARDAKIKITVSKIQKVELGSLVDDIRGMKKLTDRNNTHNIAKKPAQQKTDKPKSDKPAQQKPAQQKPVQQKPVQKKPAEAKQEQKSEQQSVQQKPVQKQTKPANEKAVQKTDKPVAEKATQQKPAQPKSDKPANEKAAQKPKKAEPKLENKVEQKVEAKAEPKQNKPATEKPVEQNTAQQKPVQKKAEAKVETKVEAKVEQKVETKAEPKKHSALGNEGKPRTRKENKPKNVRNIPASSVTVPETLGLDDFKGAKNEGFGSGDYKSGRMSNDIRKKPRITDPQKANRDALKALTINVDEENRKAREEAERARKAAEKAKEEAEKAEKAEVAPEYPLMTLESHEIVEVEVAPTAEENAEIEAVEVVEANEAAEAPVEEKKVREGVTQAEMDFALDFANTLLENMKLDAKAEAAEAGDEEYIVNGDANVYPKINIVGNDTGILIGHHGETLDAIQYLVNLSALRKSKQKDGDYVKIVVDIEGYREKREETLRALAKRMAAKAVKYKRNIFLEPMNAYERRIIHSELQFYENVSTHSVGTDKDRKIVITYEGADKRERSERRSYDGKRREERNGERRDGERRRQKPVKLPIDKLEDLLESREGE